MTLKELQGMIKEELESYMGETEVDVDVDTDGGDIDADGAEEGNTDEDVLRQIYDMLKDKFEGGEEAEDDMGDMDAEDAEEDTDAELEEAKAKDEDQVEESTTDVHTQLQERFKKLANIVKG